MINGSDVGKVTIVGGGVELFWVALACVNKKLVEPSLLTLLDDVTASHPVTSAGDWLEDLHGMLGLSHQEFLNTINPRLSIGLQVRSVANSYYIPLTKTGIPFRNSSFSRLYAALPEDRRGNFMDYNLANTLFKINPRKRPVGIEVARSEGLKFIYHIETARYRQFLMRYLTERQVKVLHIKDEKISGVGDCLPEFFTKLSDSEVGLLIDFYPKLSGSVCVADCPSSGFFAINQLEFDGDLMHHYIEIGSGKLTRSTYVRKARLDANAIEAIKAPSERSNLSGNHIRMGMHSRWPNPLAIEEAIFFQQLLGLIKFWPSSKNIAFFAGRLSRQWSAWGREIQELNDLIHQSVYMEGEFFNNQHRINLYKESGNVAFSEGGIVDESTWENILAAGFRLSPGYRGIPNGVPKELAVEHLKNIRNSFQFN